MSSGQALSVDYQSLSDSLAVLHLVPDVSELHGLLCGLLAAQAPDPKSLWLGEILDEPLDMDNLLLKGSALALERLYLDTNAAFTGLGEDFAPILPDGDVGLRQRAQALVDWSSGFIYGLGLAGANLAALSPEAREGLEAISDFTRLDMEDLNESDEADQDLTELAGFLWVSVMLIHTELAMITRQGAQEEEA